MRKKLLVIFVIPILVLQLCLNVHAIEDDELGDTKSGILQMVVTYTDEEGVEHPIQGGSGFLIGDMESGVQYILTAKEVTYVSEDMAALVIENYAKDKEISELDYATKVVIRRDVMIDAQLIAESDEMGFAIWKLSQSLYDRKPLVLCDSELTDFMGQNASTMGFPTEPDMESEATYYTLDDVVSQNGAIIGDAGERNVKFLYHNIVPTDGMLGGPILNEEGDVIAINQSKEAQNGYYAIQISEVLPVLEAMGIPYTTTSQVEARIQAELDAIVHKEELQSKITEIEALDGSLYREDSYLVLTEILAEAKTVIENAEATQDEVDSALDKLNNAFGTLEKKTPVWIIFTIIGSVVLFISIVIFIVLMKTKPKREQRKKKKIEEMTVTQAAPVFTEKHIQKEDYKTLIKQNSQAFEAPTNMKPVICEETYGETTVFQQKDDSIELFTDGRKQNAYLIRKRTGEKILITEREFVLGKDASQTDYCITGNSAVSRAHAVIICRDLDFEVADKNATNGTYVNDVKVAAFQKSPLKDGDILKLADENFEFRIAKD